ncbi:hypothetical protein ABFX02_07G042200 [Erythranthe guttata]
MENKIKRCFKAGELAEARSFEKGYRGAWFRCRIKEITKRNRNLGYVSEYYDFPDEKVKWTKFFQVPPYNVAKAKEHRELMLRPAYPPISTEKQIPSVISEVTVVVNDTWKVGDLVDWWTTGCYWSGKITQLLGNDKAQIELTQPPFGEGSFYEILLKDIRPSLDWSLEHGWTMRTEEGDTDSTPSARLIKPINQDTADIREPAILDKHEEEEETDPSQCTAGSSFRLSSPPPISSSSAFSGEAKRKAITEEVKCTKEKSDNRGNNNGENSTRANTDSAQTTTEPVTTEVAEDLNSGCSLKKKNKNIESERATLNSARSDTLEAAVMDLEECVNKVKWLKNILHNGISSSSDDASRRSRWEFVDTTTK